MYKHLGLNLVKRLAEKHGGSLEASSPGESREPRSRCGCRYLTTSIQPSLKVFAFKQFCAP
jgi:signal transduction histidine kinase